MKINRLILEMLELLFYEFTTRCNRAAAGGLNLDPFKSIGDKTVGTPRDPRSRNFILEFEGSKDSNDNEISTYYEVGILKTDGSEEIIKNTTTNGKGILRGTFTLQPGEQLYFKSVNLSNSSSNSETSLFVF